ncbi:MAG: short-subunit dehydrogenase, partial [Bacteroidia bacterium]
MDVKNKWCVVTGSSRGIGLEICKQLCELGANVVGLSRSEPPFKHKNFTFISTNVRSFESVSAAFDQIHELAPVGIDVLVNNAGLGYFGFIEDVTLNQWHEMYETNVNSIFYTCKLALPRMKVKELGHVINIASTAGIEGYPQVSAYCGTKFAVKGISESMYKELRDFGVKVTCIYPGSTKTNFFENSPIE